MKFLALIQAEFLKLARTWDELTLKEQQEYIHRHPKSKRKLTARPPLKSRGGLAIYEPRRGHAHLILKALRNAIGTESKPTWRKYLTKREGSSNKYHYFGVFPTSNGYVAANAYGRIGYEPKVHVIGRFNSEKTALDNAQTKMQKKTKKGYAQDSL